MSFPNPMSLNFHILYFRPTLIKWNEEPNFILVFHRYHLNLFFFIDYFQTAQPTSKFGELPSHRSSSNLGIMS